MNWEVVEERGKEVDWIVVGRGLEDRGREGLEEAVERVQGRLGELVEEGKKFRNWRSGKKRWWNGRVERKYREVREVEKKWERGNRLGSREEVVRKRREWKELVLEAKGEYWGEYLEGLDVNESYR